MGMTKDENDVPAAADLRRHAEERLRAKGAELHPPRTNEESQRLVHELEVHQIELEMQNAELRQARDEVENALENYTDLYDFAPVGYFTLDRNGVISAVNLTGARLLGIERSLLLGRRIGLFVADEYHQLLAEFLGRVFASQSKVSSEVTLRREGDHPHFVQLDAVADASGKECRIAVIDITKRRQLEEKLKILHTDLEARAADLEAANIELEAFNYTVSHDLRKPLTVINGYCQMVKQLCSDKLDEQSNGFIQEIYEATLRMNRLIDTLLGFSRVGRVEIRREKIELSAMAEAAAAELQLAEPERRVTFRIAEGVTGDGDARLLRILLDNLLGNAWKYTGNGEETLIEFGVTEVEGKQACFVRDNGPGFDMADAGKLFMPFQRLPGTQTEGHGIGLATVERIVSRHGGRVWTKSEPGKGATFYFTLE